MKCAIYGAGSLGTVLGAYMTKNGVEVELVNRNKAHVATLNEKGAHITGTVDFTTPVKAITPDEMSGKYDVIFLMTKQLHNKEVVTFLKPFLTEDGVIATLQNGIPEPGIAEIVGNEHTVGCPVEWGAALTAPGEATLTSEPDSLSFHMGKMPGITDRQLTLVKELLEKIEAMGVNVCYITLHVGLGTFRPVKAEVIEDHEMHSEYIRVTEESAKLINERRAAGGRVIAVGTTSCRVLESASTDDGILHATDTDTGIFIYPGYKFKMVDALITNFHLPESTLIMLVSALCGREKIMEAYETAVREKYRFFSFGDAMFIE